MPPPPENAAIIEEARLLAQAGAGDRAALRQLYARYSAPLFSLAVRLVGDHGEAEEVLQDTFVKIWRSAAAYDVSKGRPFTWMMNIARNTAIDMLRSASVRHAGSIRSIDDHVYQAGHDDVREQMENADVRRVVVDLKPEHHELIDLAYYQGFSQQEIADRTGLPLGTVKSRTRSALLELRTLLKDHR